MSAFKKRALQGFAAALLIMAALVMAVAVAGNTSGEKAADAWQIPRRPVIAHRGASWWAPEETIIAYELAMAIGADYLEMDVQRTKDGIIVAFHDDTLDRVTDVAAHYPDRKGATLDQFTLAELKRLQLGQWFNTERPQRALPHFENARIATLEEIKRSPG
jgi:glycerophosphoryl diester phosphodiesterase